MTADKVTQALTEGGGARIVVVDSSKVTRKLVTRVLQTELDGVEVLACESGTEALQHCERSSVDLVSTALRLPDMDGGELSRRIREGSPQRYIPIIVVSGDVTSRLINRDLGADITDYFDKSMGFAALATFIKGYVNPPDSVTGKVLYVEDSRVVALATRRMLENNGLSVVHFTAAQDAYEHVQQAHEAGELDVDVVLTDVYLKDETWTGKTLLTKLRQTLGFDRGALPVLVMTGDDNKQNQTALLKGGANDLVEKPIEEQRLINKLRFQLQLKRSLVDEAEAASA